MRGARPGKPERQTVEALRSSLPASGKQGKQAPALHRRRRSREADGAQVAKYVCRAQHAVPLPENRAEFARGVVNLAGVGAAVAENHAAARGRFRVAGG